MKKHLFIILLFATVLFACKKIDLAKGSSEKPVTEETPYFYYYKGAKKYLHLNTEAVFVSFKSNTTVLFPADINATKTLERKENFSNKMKQQFRTDQDYSWAEFKLGEPLGEKKYFTLLDKMKEKENIEVVAPFFKDNLGNVIGLSNFFYVKLKSSKDLEALKKPIGYL